MDESDHRQYSRMLEVIESASYNLKRLDDVIKSLDFLRNQLHDPEPGWIKEFQREWWTLEENLAWALSEEQEQLDAESVHRVRQAFHKLTELVLSKTGQMRRLYEE